MPISRDPAIGGRVAAGRAQPKSTDPSAKAAALSFWQLLLCSQTSKSEKLAFLMSKGREDRFHSW